MPENVLKNTLKYHVRSPVEGEAIFKQFKTNLSVL